MDSEEVRDFCVRVRPALVGALSLHCGDAQLAEDLAQEALARAWANWSRVSRLDFPAGWVYRVAMNLATSSLRSRGAERRAKERLRSIAAHHREPPDVAAALAVRNAISALPERQKRALVLRYFLDLPVSEAARLMRCRDGTVKSLTSRAIASLRASGQFEHVGHGARHPKETAT